ICWWDGIGTGKMEDTLWGVIMRFAAEAATPAFHARTIVRIRPNAMTAVAIPSIVSTVRSRCRNTFLRTILTSFTAAPPARPAPPPPPPPAPPAPDVRPPPPPRAAPGSHVGGREFPLHSLVLRHDHL